ncbi:MAG: helix-turn-helix transcriptional regulator [Oscillospiraceae bacterium]|nr:helix-turn-helix transcriptional regulator [Oscillospiraceae bacterium]MBR3534701.1 helix-turn-helix transcriptional regulator [Oscillospiraceae bacterium]
MKELNYKEIGSRIRTQRELYGLTREKLAEKLDVSPKFCSDIELGIKGVSLKTLANLSDILDMNVDYLLFGEEQGANNELSTLAALYQKCPVKHRSNLISVVKMFVDAAIER